MTCFTGFKRKVVAILMKDDEYQERVKTVGLTGTQSSSQYNVTAVKLQLMFSTQQRLTMNRNHSIHAKNFLLLFRPLERSSTI